MISYIFKALRSFRSVFSHSSTWLKFCMIVLGFIGATEMIGITSFCRFYGLNENGYYNLLYFFRYSGWSLSALSAAWASFVFSQNLTISVNGRNVLIGDHTYVPKDARRMPGCHDPVFFDFSIFFHL